MLSQCTIQRCEHHRDPVQLWSSWQHCLLSCPVASGAVPPLPVAFGQHELLIAQPRTSLCHGCTSSSVGRCRNVLGNEELGMKISTSCSKSPEPARTRSLGFACCLSWVMRSGTVSGSSGPSVHPAQCTVTVSDP